MPSSEAELSSADLRAVLAVLPELYTAGDMATFPRLSLRIINRLLPAKFSSYNEINLGTGGARVFYEPEAAELQSEPFRPMLKKHLDQHPLMRLYEQGDVDGVIKISDFLSRAALHNLDIYHEALHPLGLEDTLSFTLSSAPPLQVFFAVNSGTRFTERDRAVAAALQPHLIQAFGNAIALTAARALVPVSMRAIASAGEHGAILATRNGRVVHISEHAAKHLAALFPGELHETLAPDILRWLAHEDHAPGRPCPPLELNVGDRIFLLRSGSADQDHWLIATREVNAASLKQSLTTAYRLTPREADVLLWVSQGKRNLEVASILGNSVRTVAKHLEAIFEKLGVENREGALLKALEVLGPP